MQHFHFILMIALALFTVPFFQSCAQSNGQVLASKGGFTLTTAHIQLYNDYTELLTMQPLSATEKNAIKQNIVQLFNQFPAQIVNFAAGLQADFTAFAQITDAAQQGLAWGLIKGYYYQNTYPYADDQLAHFAKLIKQRAPIIAYNANNKTAISETDLNGIIYFMQFKNKVAGNNNIKTDKNAFKQELQRGFATYDNPTIAQIMYYAYMGTALEAAMKPLSAKEQQQFIAQLKQQQNNASIATDNTTCFPTNKSDAQSYNQLIDQIIYQNNLTRHNMIQDMSVGGYKEYWYSNGSNGSSILGW